MKTPEETRKELEHCRLGKPCVDCPYDRRDFPYCVARLMEGADTCITQLEQRLAQVERERDAAVREWKRTKMDSESMCWTCKHALVISSCRCRCVSPVPCDEGENWEWRGVCEENSKEVKNG